MLTISEASERVGITQDALRQAIVRGSLTAQRVGPLYLVSSQDVDAYKVRTGGKRGRPRKAPKEEG